MTSSSKSATEGGAANADAAPVKRYSLFTAICLIVGICIGSGIFFKSDNILIATDGNVALGVAMMLLAATTIVFGGLTLARFAARTTGHGGLIAYAEEFLGPRRAAFIGWNFTFLYMPVVCSVLSWVVGVYACMTFNLPGTFAWQMGIGLVFLLACTAWNILWPTLSGYFQNLTTLAKALPLVLVGVIGLMVNDPVAQLSSDIAAAPAAGTAWIAAAAPHRLCLRRLELRGEHRPRAQGRTAQPAPRPRRRAHHHPRALSGVLRGHLVLPRPADRHRGGRRPASRSCSSSSLASKPVRCPASSPSSPCSEVPTAWCSQPCACPSPWRFTT